MNRFFDIDSICSRELLPAALTARGEPVSHPVFALAGTLRFRSDIAGGVIVLPDGFESDLASIPATAQSLFLDYDDPRIAGAAWVHDHICHQYDKGQPPGVITLEDGRTVTLTNDQAARILAFEGMADLGATKAQQWLVYLAVKWFGPKF